MDKKHQQLGMNPSTASGRLVKDLLFHYLMKNGTVCFRCGKEMARETFSIEHKIPWLDSDDPVGMFFDLTNITFSHQECNFAAKRSPNQLYFTPEAKQEAGRQQTRRWRRENPEKYSQQRRAKYLRTGT